jgi:radical SAM superfamily enzyme YgiQ (UPF0313 family)
MKNPNFLIIVPRYFKSGNFYHFPIGLAYISAALKKAGLNVVCLNLAHRLEPIGSLIKQTIEKYNIDVVCTGGMSIHWNLLEQILQNVEKIKPEILTVLGGPLVTSQPNLAMANLNADIGVLGEGEETIVAIAHALQKDSDFSQVAGLIFRNSKRQIVMNSPPKEISNLDTLPFPDYEAFEFSHWVCLNWEHATPDFQGLFFDEGKLPRMAEILCSRSCPFNCTFCYHPLGKKYRQRTLDNIFAEIDFLVQSYKIGFLRIIDELFSYDKKRIFEFTERIKKYNLKWSAQLRIENIDRDVLKILKNSNCLSLGLGVESMSNTVLKSMRKNITVVQIEKALQIAREERIMATGNIILGDPAETKKTVQESLSWAFANPQFTIYIYFILAVPVSAIYKYAVAKYLIIDELDFLKKHFPVINLTKMTNFYFTKIRWAIIYFNLVFKRLKYCKILDVTTEESTRGIKKTYFFKLLCPFCESVSTYKHSQWTVLPFFPVVCKQCFASMKVRTGDIFKMNYNPLAGYLNLVRSFLFDALGENFLFKSIVEFYHKIRYGQIAA